MKEELDLEKETRVTKSTTSPTIYLINSSSSKSEFCALSLKKTPTVIFNKYLNNGQHIMKNEINILKP